MGIDIDKAMMHLITDNAAIAQAFTNGMVINHAFCCSVVIDIAIGFWIIS
jgi:hypothetical protein